MNSLIHRCAAVIITLLLLNRSFSSDPAPEIATALERAAENREQIQKALNEIPLTQKPGMEFLIANMPDRDLKSLSAQFLIENVQLAYQAWEQAPWKSDVAEEVFFNDVLPYANINEGRDRWRKDFYERFQPLVKDAKSPGHAATILNQKIFEQLNVRYSTRRKHADQAPYESIETGLASCTGLSILLIDACRAVGVPARFAGTPMWTDRSGNHSWVEVWDKGDWHFTGAAEPAGDKLDQAWFISKAAAAQADSRMHAIYAVSFRRTGQTFPLVWDPSIDYVFALNVTERYAATPDSSAVDVEASCAAVASLQAHLAMSDSTNRVPIVDQPFSLVPLTHEDADRVVQLLWDNHVATIRESRAAEMEARTLTDGDLAMPFYYEVFGDKPDSGRSLYISLHGGGGAPAELNDRQWENQKKLYSPGEGVYVAPRAPTNTWDLWHQSHIDRLFQRLIENMIVFEDVNPNRVYVMGYSAGGDGVYQLAPRMADYWAAASMMAGHPNETSPLGLRNVPFSIHVGELDSAYNRNEVAKQWQQQLADLHARDQDGYVHLAKIYPGKKHWLDREDASALAWMAEHVRSPLPNRIVWKQDDVTHSRFYWLAIRPENAKAGDEVIVQNEDQHIDIEKSDPKQLLIRLNDQLLDLDKPLTITAGKETLFEGRAPRTIGVLANTLEERGDRQMMFSAEIIVETKD